PDRARSAEIRSLTLSAPPRRERVSGWARRSRDTRPRIREAQSPRRHARANNATGARSFGRARRAVSERRLEPQASRGQTRDVRRRARANQTGRRALADPRKGRAGRSPRRVPPTARPVARRALAVTALGERLAPALMIPVSYGRYRVAR